MRSSVRNLPQSNPLGNRLLTMISVWLGRKDAPIALVLTCWQGMQASALDGPPMRQNKALARALGAALSARLWNRAAICCRGFGTPALRGYDL